jgi:ERCC4-related helicase
MGDVDKLREYRHILDNWQGTTGLNKFLLGEIQRLSCVTALNEGHNLGKIDVAFIVQLNSKQLHFIQRIGRILRWSLEHKGQIIILVARDTIDEEWARKATYGLEETNIRWVKIEDILEGRKSLETIKLNIVNEPETADI